MENNLSLRTRALARVKQSQEKSTSSGIASSSLNARNDRPPQFTDALFGGYPKSARKLPEKHRLLSYNLIKFALISNKDKAMGKDGLFMSYNIKGFIKKFGLTA